MPLNPTLSKKEEAGFTLNDNTKRLFQVIYRENNKSEADDEGPKIKVSELISRLAFYYEKIRNSVDYKEEYLLRKSSILRILKRQVIIEGPLKTLNAQDIAKNLLIELIRAGYLKNNKLPETKIGELALIIDKYLKLKVYISGQNQGEKQDYEINKWILSMASAEIEEKLCNNPVSQVIISNMYESLSKHVALPEDSIYQADREIHIYLSIYRVFMKFDDDMLAFLLLKYYCIKWPNASDEEIKYVARSIEDIRSALAEQMNDPLVAQIIKIVNQ